MFQIEYHLGLLEIMFSIFDCFQTFYKLNNQFILNIIKRILQHSYYSVTADHSTVKKVKVNNIIYYLASPPFTLSHKTGLQFTSGLSAVTTVLLLC